MAKAIPVVPAAREAPVTNWWLHPVRVLNQSVVPRLILIVMCAVFILPLFWMVSVALKPTAELSLYPPTFWPQQLRWENFSDAINVFPFWQYLRNTSIVTGLTVLGAVISNPIIAYGFSRIDWPGRDKVFFIVLATVFIPYPVLIIALFDIFARLGWINTFWPLTVPLFFGNPFWIFLLRQFFMQISQEVSDAARIDGASELRILFQIIMPQALPALAVVALFAALHAWNDFLGPLLYLQDASMYTLAVGLTFFQSASQYDIQFNLLMAASLLVVAPVITLFLIFQRAFIEGISFGGSK
ncbi:MAG: carbohydrate ABC transporter permease [Chloroflexota bacterium]|nr:carbohydrate ABC transporter permease [Chloroflexota bacterium]